MPRVKKTTVTAAADDFDLSAAPPVQAEPTAGFEDGSDDNDEADSEQPNPTIPAQAVESPEQRRIMREKRIAKAEEEQLRRLMRQFPVVARLARENEQLKQQLRK